MDAGALCLFALIGAAVFVLGLWGIGVSAIWKLERWLFFRSVGRFEEKNSKKEKRKCG